MKNCIFANSKKNILKIMDLKEILAIIGKKGLYKVVSREKSRIIVESLLDNTRMSVFPSSRPSALEKEYIIFNQEKLFIKDSILIHIQKLNNTYLPDKNNFTKTKR